LPIHSSYSYNYFKLEYSKDGSRVTAFEEESFNRDVKGIFNGSFLGRNFLNIRFSSDDYLGKKHNDFKIVCTDIDDVTGPLPPNWDISKNPLGPIEILAVNWLLNDAYDKEKSIKNEMHEINEIEEMMKYAYLDFKDDPNKFQLIVSSSGL
jgi:hypothetical protein